MNSLQKLQAKMAEAGVPGVLVSDIVNVGWMTGFSGSSGIVLATPDAARFLTDSRYTIQAGEEISVMPSYSFASPMSQTDFVAQHAREMGIERLGFEAENLTYSSFETWRDAMPGIEFVPLKNFVSPLRMVKTDDEVAKIRHACGISDAAFAHVKRLIQPGVTELDIAIELDFFMRRQGAGVAFETIVVSGNRSARPHGRASDKKLEKGDFVTMDFGARYQGYHSDMTRTIVVGEATDRHREVYGQVLKAQLAALEMMRPGVRARDVDARAREVFDEIGLAKYFGHGLGHGLGRLVHDTGRLASSSDDVLEPGQVWTVEPGVYIEGFGGVRIEDDVVVTQDGIEILNHTPKDLLILP